LEVSGSIDRRHTLAPQDGLQGPSLAHCSNGEQSGFRYSGRRRTRTGASAKVLALPIAAHPSGCRRGGVRQTCQSLDYGARGDAGVSPLSRSRCRLPGTYLADALPLSEWPTYTANLCPLCGWAEITALGENRRKMINLHYINQIKVSETHNCSNEAWPGHSSLQVLWPGAFGPQMGFAVGTDDDAALCESDLLADLHHPVPTRALHGGTDVLGADVAFAEVLFVHPATR
jgi:hypothetical protein